MADPSVFLPPSDRLAASDPLREALRICRAHLSAALVFSFLINAALLGPTIYMLQVYDRVMQSNSLETLGFLTIALAVVLLLQSALDQLRQRLMFAASVRLDRVFALRVFKRLLVAQGGKPQMRTTRALRDLDVVRAAATGPGMLALFDLPWTLIYIAVCFTLHWAIGLTALVGGVMVFALALLNEAVSRRYYLQAAQAQAVSSMALESASDATDVITALGMSEAFTTAFEDLRVGAHLPQLEAQRATGRIGGFVRFLRLLLQSGGLGLGAYLAIERQITPGMIFASSMLIARALSPIDMIVAQWRGLQQARIAYDDLKDLLRSTPIESRLALPRSAGRLSVEGVSASIPGAEQPILRSVSLTVEAGSFLVVIGPSGAGKTTLLKLIAGARLPDGGKVRLDGADYADWEPDTLGRLVGYVPQDSVLFPGTIRDNVSRFESRRGVPADVIDRQVIAAARAAGLHDLILRLGAGYETLLGPRGRGLSAGQQQRLALARALYGDPTLLVLDEPNANLDTEGDVQLLATLVALKRGGKTLVVSSHRRGLVDVADRIAVMRNGALDRIGPREEVLAYLRPRQLRPTTPQPPATSPIQ